MLESKEFKDWVVGSGKSLWCTGIPGAGKTVFTSIVVDRLRQIAAGPRVAISYVYCSYKDDAVQNPTSLIASILQQTLKRTMVVSDDLRALYERHEPYNTRPTVEELSVQLQASVRNLEQFFVIIDALDEISDVKSGEFLDRIRNLQPAINLMITTRPASHVANGFPEAACMEIWARDPDIQSYCEARIRSDHRLHCVHNDADLKKNVIITIAKNAQKMFLLAVLQIETLASQLNKAQVRNALKQLPKELDDTYREALQRIDRQSKSSRKLANHVLSWISYACRPLTIEELQCALAVKPGQPTFDEDEMTPGSKLVSVCAGLVTVDSESGIIRLVHYTTQEYFEKIRSRRFPNAQAKITRSCLTYLSFDHQRYYDTTYKAILHNIESSPFLSYAAQNWRDHMRASPETNFNELILQILSQPEKVQCIVQAMDEYSLNVSDIYKDLNVPPLCAAVILGLESIMLLLLERGADLTESVSCGGTALELAARFAQLEVIKILIDRGASVNSQKRSPLLAVIYAAGDSIDETKAVAAARLLLDRVAEMNYQFYLRDYVSSPLIVTADFGSIRLVELLLMYGADANLRAHHGSTALHMADPGKPRIFQLLVDHGADLHARDNSGNPPLSVSCRFRDKAEDTVRLLLDLGADIDSRNNSGETPLFRAAEMGCCRIIQVLMDYGADIHARSKLGRSVLFSAIDTEYCKPDRVVQFLLEFGADVHAQDSAGDTALARAAAKGLSGTVKLMLDHKSKIDTSNEAGDTALTLAAAAEAMLVGSFRYDEKGGYHHIDDATRLAASAEGILTSMELLLNHGASVDLKNNAGDTALTLAAAKGKLDAVKLLLNYGANAHAMNEAGDTALSLTTQNGHSEVRQLLLEHLFEPTQPSVCAEAK